MVKNYRPEAKNWCFTQNNPKSKHWDAIWSFPYRYLVFQVEVGEEGTPHIQGYVQFETKLRLSALKKLLPKAHWEISRGTPYEASHYCKKPVPECDCEHCKDLERFDRFYEDGIISHGDVATKLTTVARVIKAKGLEHAKDRFPDVYMHYHAGMEKLAAHYLPDRDFQPRVTIVWGKSMMGKSRFVQEAWPTVYIQMPTSKGQADFVGDYHPDVHDTYVLDEFYGQKSMTYMLRLLDRYSMEVQTKGGHRKFLSHYIVLTSNVSPDKWYEAHFAKIPEHRDAFNRRINDIIHFPGPYGKYTIQKVINYRPIPHYQGSLPFPPPDWMSQMDVHDVLMRNHPPPLQLPLDVEFSSSSRSQGENPFSTPDDFVRYEMDKARRREWLARQNARPN